FDAVDLPPAIERAFDHGADHCIEAGTVAAASDHADAFGSRVSFTLVSHAGDAGTSVQPAQGGELGARSVIAVRAKDVFPYSIRRERYRDGVLNGLRGQAGPSRIAMIDCGASSDWPLAPHSGFDRAKPLFPFHRRGCGPASLHLLHLAAHLLETALA